MPRKRFLKICISCLCLSSFLLINAPAFAASQAVEYLCELGIAFYRLGRYDDAVMEFNKALMLDPNNQTAKKYIDNIFKQTTPKKISKELPKKVKPQPERKISREEVFDETLNKLARKEGPPKKPEIKPTTKETKPKEEPLKISGQIQLSVGITPQDTIWKLANADLNEENWRTLSEAAYNRRANTYDPRIFDRLMVNLDTKNEEGFGFHSNITIDPWSFIGKSDKMTILGAGGDSAEFELLYWSNTRYTFNHTVFTEHNGDSFSLPEMKVVDGSTSSTSITSVNNNIFTIPETDIDYEFWPLRKLWLDYKQENLKFRVFPMAYQDQALTSDDPLRLSNNHVWWEESPWLDSWHPGNFNEGATPDDFSKGFFDDSLSYSTRDSDGTRLTALRGLSFSFTPQDATSFNTTVASPKGLWQDYNSFDNFASASRLKHSFTDNFSLGSTYTFRLGLNEDKNDKKDITNHVMGVDLGYEIIDGLKMYAQAAQSFTKEDLTSPDYATKSRGNAYYFSLLGRFPQESIMDLNTYDEIKPEDGDKFFAKARLFLARMDEGFEPTLSTYRETRDDQFWSRHIHFKRPFEYYFSGLYYPGMRWEDIEPFRIGNGIDVGRSVIGFRLETSAWDKTLDNLFDVRNVHDSSGKFVENVARDEVTYKVNDKLTTKLLGIYHKLHKTYGGVDPFVFNNDTGIYLNNSAIADGKDPGLKTGSLGLEYAFTDWLSANGIWEHTNDYTLAYDNFPRGNLSDTSFVTYTEYNKVYRRQDPFLYSQGLFPLPPYPFYDIFKAGLRIMPIDKLELYLDYTRNEFKSAGQIDDNINHIGFEVSYLPSKKFGIYFRYVYSRWNDLTLMTQGYDKYYLGHHNFFSELRYHPTIDDEFVMQYGESGRSNVATTYTDPFSLALPTLDTQHIFRLYYRRKF